MNSLRRIHFLLSVLPLLWFITVMISFCAGGILLGHVPREGWDDPGQLGLGWLTPIIGLGIFLVLVNIFCWSILTLGLLFSEQSRKVISKKSILIFSLGVAGFFIARNSFDGLLLWVLD